MSEDLLEVLEEAKRLGFLGPTPVTEHVEHSRAFSAAVPEGFVRAMDLGSGGGVPGLVLAIDNPSADVVLLEATGSRTDFLERSVRFLGLEHCSVVRARAEDAGRDPSLRGKFDRVLARSFGPPAVTSECAAPFISTRGYLIVSEPPVQDGTRWPAEGIARLGLVFEEAIGDGPHFALLRQAEVCPERFPRRAGVPERRPLFGSR